MIQPIKQIKKYKELHSDVISKMHHKKHYYHDALHYSNKLLNNKPCEANKIYWDEILFRIHFASVTSIMRNEKWLEGVLVSIEKENFLLFAASLRGFLEAVTDSYYSLLNVPFDIACNFKNIKLGIEGKLEELLVSANLEETLIHFQFASRSNKTGMPYNKALYTSDYIRNFDKYSDINTRKLYSELCGVVHPAANSLYPFTINIRESEACEYGTTVVNLDTKYINNVLGNHCDTILELLKFAIITPVISLKVLNLFEYELIESSYLASCIVNDMINEDVWNKIVRLAEMS